MKYQSHPLKYVIPMLGYDLICRFKNGETKVFNMEPVFQKYPEFNKLKEGDFYKAHVDLGGLCVTFNDELDLSEETLYQNGRKYDVAKENKIVEKRLYEFCKECRKHKKVTQKEVSDLTKIPQSGIARIETGTSDIHVSTLLAYLRSLGLHLAVCKNDGTLIKAIK